MSYAPKSDFLKIMIERGFVAECTDYEGLDNSILNGNIAAYIGFDATAQSLHVGSLIQIMMLRWLQKTGGQPITLMGGGTTKVGDPSFRADERPLLSEAQIEGNISGIKKVFSAEKTFFIPEILPSICASLSKGLSSALNEGSPTLVVPPPMSVIGWPPVFCNHRSIIIWIKLPTCKD